MKEFIRVRFSDCIKPLSELVQESKYFQFVYHNPELDYRLNKTYRLWTIGIPKSIEGDCVVFKTQDFVEDVPLKIANTGTQISIIKDRLTKEVIATGIVEEKYFSQTQKGDFRIAEELNTNNSSPYLCSLSFNSLEKTVLEYGFCPLTMEDKWYFFVENDRIRFFRSWTGAEYFSANLLQIAEDKWGFVDALMHHDGINNEDDIFFLIQLLQSYLSRISRLFE